MRIIILLCLLISVFALNGCKPKPAQVAPNVKKEYLELKEEVNKLLADYEDLKKTNEQLAKECNTKEIVYDDQEHSINLAPLVINAAQDASGRDRI